MNGQKSRTVAKSPHRAQATLTYPCAAGREISIYASPHNGGKSGGTVAACEVNNLEKTVDELTADGVIFEQVDRARIKTNQKGIAELGP